MDISQVLSKRKIETDKALSHAPFILIQYNFHMSINLCVHKNLYIRGLSRKFADNRHLTFFNENLELKPISCYT